MTNSTDTQGSAPSNTAMNVAFLLQARPNASLSQVQSDLTEVATSPSETPAPTLVFPFEFKGNSLGIVVDTERLISLCEDADDSDSIICKLAGEVFLWANAQWADAVNEADLIEAGKRSCFRIVRLNSM